MEKLNKHKFEEEYELKIFRVKNYLVGKKIKSTRIFIFFFNFL